jgi:hypothetical protein
MTCGVCGKRNPEGTMFCSSCGTHRGEAMLINRRLNIRLVIAFALLCVTLLFRWLL